MATAKGTIKQAASTGYSSNVLLGNLKTDILNGIANSTTAVATATKIDAFARAANAISTDSYDDTIISVDYSATEILVE